jgi:hypothetical protein
VKKKANNNRSTQSQKRREATLDFEIIINERTLLTAKLGEGGMNILAFNVMCAMKIVKRCSCAVQTEI